MGQAAQVLKMKDGAAVLAAKFWPGALTIVGERVDDLADELGGDASSVGVRCPDAAYVSELCRRVGPIAVTSKPIATASRQSKARRSCVSCSGRSCSSPTAGRVAVHRRPSLTYAGLTRDFSERVRSISKPLLRRRFLQVAREAPVDFASMFARRGSVCCCCWGAFKPRVSLASSRPRAELELS